MDYISTGEKEETLWIGKVKNERAYASMTGPRT